MASKENTTLIDSMNLLQSSGQENIPNVFSNASTEYFSLPVEKESDSVNSIERNFVPEAKDFSKYSVGPAMDAKDDCQKGLLQMSSGQSLVGEQGLTRSLPEVKETSGCLNVEATMKVEACVNEEDGAFNTSEAIENSITSKPLPLQDEMHPKVVERENAGPVGDSLQDCSLAVICSGNLVPDEQERVPVGRIEEHFVLGEKNMLKDETEPAMDVKDNHGMLLFEGSASPSSSMAQEVNGLLLEGKETCENLTIHETVMEEANVKVEDHTFNTSTELEICRISKPDPLQDEVSPKEVEKACAGPVGGSSEDIQLVATSTAYSVTVEEEVESVTSIKESYFMGVKDIAKYPTELAFDAKDDHINEVLDASSSGFRPMQQGLNGSLTEVNETSGLTIRASVKEEARTEKEESAFSCSELKEIHSYKSLPLEEETSPKEDIREQAETASGFPRDCSLVGTSTENHSVPFDSSCMLSSQNLELNRGDERQFDNVGETTVKPLLPVSDGINRERDQPEEAFKSGSQPKSESAFDSSSPMETTVIPYDPYYWTPMEIEAATGNADCNSLRHDLKLKSAYTEVEDYAGTKDSSGEPLVTSYNRRFMGTVDYVWHTEGLQTVKVLDTLPTHILQRTRGFPTHKWGSDHLALACQLAFTPKSAVDEDHPTGSE
eukprot:Gb_02571 [translate_table: standard]